MKRIDKIELKIVRENGFEEIRIDLEELYERYSIMKGRIDRAIVFVSDRNIKFPSAIEWREHLLDILKGSDSNE